VIRAQDLARAVWGDGVVMIERGGPPAVRPNSSDWAPRHNGADMRAARPRAMGPSQEALAEMRAALQPMVSTWWKDLPVEDRQELEAELPTSRGLPQDADRHLLLRLSQQLGRPLTPGEKKLMRELARDTALGNSSVQGETLETTSTADREPAAA
jgi:hypothetical protein